MSIPLKQEDRDYQARIAELQVRDSLTGLYNRKHFIRLTTAEVKKRREGAVQALLYIRPDRFSGIDERFGPVASDAVLRQLGLLIEDKAGKPSVAARFGGNIFTLLLVRRSFGEVQQLAEHLLNAIASEVFTAGELSTSMTASIGLVELSESIEDSTQAFSLAQASAKLAREEGGNQIQVNRSLELDEKGELHDAGWKRKIRSALESNAFHLVYQPVANLMGAPINGSDVLLRMLEHDGEEIMPGEFMPAAERTGLMPSLDRWVIEHALEVSEQRRAAGKRSLLFLRISEPSLREQGFLEWLDEQAGLRRVGGSSIVLQVSEDVVSHNLAQVRALARVCSRLKFRLAVSNFGVGDNCLQLIQLIRMDYLILDGRFMQALDDPHQRLQLELIVGAAQNKQIPTIATRVENAQALAELCHMGIDYVMGYHVQEPEETIVDSVALPD